jgi:hypothetical protein
MSSENPTFQAIESTRSILGESWKEHWSKILKPEVITAYLLWLKDKDSKEEGSEN